MEPDRLTVTYVGGPTCLVEFGGVRLLTDPTFDPAGGEYRTGPVTLRKLAGPALSPEALGPFDAVLLSHDHHADNLDHAGRRLLASAKRVLTTPEGAGRLGGNSIGLAAWQSTDLEAPGGRVLRVAAVRGRRRSGSTLRGSSRAAQPGRSARCSAPLPSHDDRCRGLCRCGLGGTPSSVSSPAGSRASCASTRRASRSFAPQSATHRQGRTARAAPQTGTALAIGSAAKKRTYSGTPAPLKHS